jgi:glycosyltransferase involved in cell wall biosynthesis
VVIPSYNEEGRLGASLEKIAAWIRDRETDAEILVVDDGSTDGTRTVAERFLAGAAGRVIRLRENAGKGCAVRTGILEAASRWCLITDADLSTPIEEYEKLAEAVRERDMDVAIGSRGMEESRIEIAQHPLRRGMGKTFNHIIRLMTGLPYRDTQCGFKLMDRERVLPLFGRMVVDRFAFDVEFLYLCHRYGLRVVEVPVIWRNDPATRVRLVSDPINMLYDVLRVRWRFRRGLYDPTRESGGGEPS